MDEVLHEEPREWPNSYYPWAGRPDEDPGMNRYPEPTRVPERPYDAGGRVARVRSRDRVPALGVPYCRMPHGRPCSRSLIAGGLGAILGVNNLMLELGNQGFCFKRGYDEGRPPAGRLDRRVEAASYGCEPWPRG